MTSHVTLIHNLADSATRAAKALVGAASVQWEPGARLSARSEGAAGGTVSDPTFAVVADPRRLRVRAAVIAAERDFERAARVLDARAVDLARAVEAWQGAPEH